MTDSSSSNSSAQTNVSRASDPTKAILSKSALSSKYLNDYTANVATGCSHGCKFCYVPATPNIRMRQDMLKSAVDVDDGQEEWGDYVLYRDGLGEKLAEHLPRKRVWRNTRGGQGIVGISYSTDPFMDRRAGDIAASCISALAANGKYARVQTRNPLLAAHYLETFRDAGDYVTVGSSINSLRRDEVHAIEPNAPSPAARLEGLERFAEASVNTFVSMSPTYPTMTKSDLRAVLERVQAVNPDVVFHEPINPRGKNYELTVAAAEAAGEVELAEALTELQSEGNWVEYACQHFRWVQEIARDLSLDINLWPDDELIRLVEEGSERERWLGQWRVRQSPESFAERPSPNGKMPALPQTSKH